MLYTLIAPANDDLVFDVPANRGYSRELVEQHLDRLAYQGHAAVVEPMVDETRREAYLEVAVHASRLGIQVSRVFGSRTQSGIDRFGREVPALLVSESAGGKLVGVYPHSHKHEPGEVTIVEYLTSVPPSTG